MLTSIRSVFSLSWQDAQAGVRIATIALLPLIFGSLTGRAELGLMGYMGGLYACMADVGGAYQTRALSMGYAAVFTALAAFLSTLAGGVVWLAVPLMFFGAFLGSMVSIYGNIGSKVGFNVVCVFAIVLSMPAGPVVAWERFGVFIFGGIWAMLLSLWLWPLRPYQPVRVAVASYYRALSTFIDRIGHAALHEKDTSSFPISVTDSDRSQVVTAQENARNIFVQVRSAQHGSGSVDRCLGKVALNASSLFDTAIALMNGIRNIAKHPYIDRALKLLERTGSEIADILTRCALAIERGDCEIDLANIDQVKNDIEVYDAELHRTVPRTEADYQARVRARYLLRRLRAMIDDMQVIVEGVQQLCGDEQEEQKNIAPWHFPGVNVQSAMQTFQDNLTFRSITFRHALRVSIASTLAVALYMLLQLPHGFWIPLTVIIILKPDFGSTRQRALQRMTGTLLGGIGGGLLVAINHDLLIYYLFLWLLGSLAFAYRLRNYTVFALFLTPFVVLLVDLAHPGDWQISLLRIFNTLVGGALALLAGFVVWPQWTHEQLPEQLARTIEANRRYFDCVLSAYIGRPCDMDTLRGVSREARLENANAAAAFQRLMSEPKAVRRNDQQYYALVAYNQQLYDSVTVLQSQLSTLKGGYHTLPGLEQFVRQAEDLLKRLEEDVCEGYHPIETDQFEESVQEVQSSLSELRAARLAELSAGLFDTPNREAMTAFSPVNIELDRLAHEVVGMAHIQDEQQ